MSPSTSMARCTLLLTLHLVACDDTPDGSDVTPVTERTTVGDTTFVRVISGSVWGAPIVAVEEMAIGALDGPDELTFGFISQMAPDASGGLYLFDGNAPALRYYDAAGRFVRKLGGEGAGPGEYHDAALGLAVRSDGRVVLRDPRNARLNVYNPDGSYADAWPVASGLFTSQAMMIDTLDHVYLKILLGRPQENEPWPVGLLHLDAEGAIVDTIPPPRIDGEPKEAANGRFLPQKYWALSRYGQVIIGVSDEYRFEIRNPGGTVVRVEMEWTPLPIPAEERREWQAFLDWRWERQGQFMTSEMQPLPDEKPAYRGFFPGLDGTIWVHVHVPAEKREVTAAPDSDGPPAITWAEPWVFDAFEADGTYLGRVLIPPRTSISAFSRTDLWGVRRRDFDEQYAVRLRVEDPRQMLETSRDR